MEQEMHAMETSASHTVTLRGGGSEVEFASEVIGRERKKWEVFGYAGSGGYFKGLDRLDTSRIPVRESRAGHATEEMVPAVIEWVRNRSGKHGLFALRIFGCVAERQRAEVYETELHESVRWGNITLLLERSFCGWSWTATEVLSYASPGNARKAAA